MNFRNLKVIIAIIITVTLIMTTVFIGCPTTAEKADSNGDATTTLGITATFTTTVGTITTPSFTVTTVHQP